MKSLALKARRKRLEVAIFAARILGLAQAAQPLDGVRNPTA
jgi:hypothetical protein